MSEAAGLSFKCDRTTLFSAVSIVGKVAATKGVHPVYESIELSEDSGDILMAATDLETAVRVRVPEATVTSPGVAVVRASSLRDFLGAGVGVSTVEFGPNGKDREWEIVDDPTRFTLFGQAPDDFPAWPGNWESSLSLAVPSATLARVVALVVPCMAQERMRFALNYVALIAFAGESFQFAATDGRRACVLPTPSAPQDARVPGFLLPAKTLRLAAQLAREGDIGLDVGEVYARLYGPGWDVIGRLGVGGFPNVRDVFPESPTWSLRVPREPLVRVLPRVGLATARDAHSVALSFADGWLRIEANSAEGRCASQVAAEVTGEMPRMFFDPTLLIPTFSAMSGDHVTLEGSGQKQPVATRDDDGFRFVCMPRTAL